MSRERSEPKMRARRDECPAPSSDGATRLATTPMARREFHARFDHCFRHVYAYVSRRVSDREACERIVSEVLTANLDLLVERTDDWRDLRSIKAFSDRLIELEVAKKESAETPPRQRAVPLWEYCDAPTSGGAENFVSF